MTGARKIPANKEILLLGYDTDVLTPANELEKLSVVLGQRQGFLFFVLFFWWLFAGFGWNHTHLSTKYKHVYACTRVCIYLIIGSQVHFEALASKIGHDGFLVETQPLNYRFNAFLNEGIHGVRAVVREMHWKHIFFFVCIMFFFAFYFIFLRFRVSISCHILFND